MKREKLPVVQTVVFAYQHLFDHRQQFMYLAGIPAIILVAVWTLYDWANMTATDHDPGNAGQLADLVFAWFSLRWHRLFLIERPLGAGWKRTFIFITSAGIFLFLWVLLIVFPAVLLAGTLLPSVQEVATQEPAPEFIGLPVILGLILFFPVSSIVLRFLTVFPAIALGELGDLGAAWKLTRGNGIRIATIIVLATLPVVAIVFGVAAVFSALEGSTNLLMASLQNVVLAVVLLSLVAVTAVCSAKSYMALGGSVI